MKIRETIDVEKEEELFMVLERLKTEFEKIKKSELFVFDRLTIYYCKKTK